jgi:hypothetical protein
MSSSALVEGPDGLMAAWETEGQIYFGRVDSETGRVRSRIPAPGAAADRKHPALAVGKGGEVLLAWTEGTGWQKGGDLVWQTFDASGPAQPSPVTGPGASGRAPGGIPTWSLPTAITLPGGGFAIIH